MSSPKVSLQTIADAAGVTRATVSLAMRNHPRISEATRQRVQKLAVELGYRPNAEVSRLMSMLREQRPLTDRPVMALISDMPHRLSSASPPSPTWQGFATRAEALGYLPEEFQVTAHLSPARLTRILHARSVRCMVFAALLEPGIVAQMDLSTFSIAAIGNFLHEPAISRCTSDKYANTLLACERLWSAGCRRLAIVIPARQEERVEHTFLSGYLIFHHLHRHGGWRIPLIFEEPWNIRKILDWLQKQRCDGVVAAYPELNEAFKARKGRTNHQPLIGLVNVMQPGCSGINQRHDLIASGAVDLVDAQHRRNETGPPNRPKTIMIRGDWVDGSPDGPPPREAG